MSRESKIIQAYDFGVQTTIKHYESFGWELLTINGNQITMSRETQNPVYSDLVKLQSIYEETLAAYNSLRSPIAPLKPARVSIKTLFVSFICLVIPCAIYVTYKILQNKKYKEALAVHMQNMDAYINERQRLRNKMEEVALQGYTTFFSQQQK